MHGATWPALALGALLLHAPVAVAGTDLAGCLAAPTRDCLIAAARDRLEQVPASGERASLLAALGVEQARAGLDADASASFARAVEEAEAQPEPVQRVQSLGVIAGMQADAERPDDARRLLQLAASAARNAANDGEAVAWSRALRAIADRQVELGDRAGAADTLGAAAETARAIADPFQRSAELILVGSRQAAQAHDTAPALATFGAAKAAATEISDGELRAGMLLSVGQSQLEAGLTDPGLQALREALAASAALPPAAGRSRVEATIALVLLKHMSQ